ncbi:MAG: type IV toxin-antitoxin system AbiEi family antitoxin [Rikenellaceae bacterium]
MTIREWVREIEVKGEVSFSVDTVIKNFPNMTEQSIRNDLYRLNTQKIISTVYNGFYVIIPVQYASKGIVPSVYYIDQLMEFVGKPYYISLLNAAEFFGAAHQRPQSFCVTTILPKSTVSKDKNNELNWIYRSEIPEKFLCVKNSESGTVRYSNAELTAVDLVQYSQYVGSMSRASTILAELVEQTDFSNKVDELLQFTTLSTIQRLGYILEFVLEEIDQAEVIYTQLIATKRRLNYVSLNPQGKRKSNMKDKKWRININSQIEIDEI